MRYSFFFVLVITGLVFTACENSRVSTYPKGTPSYSDAMVNNNAEALKLADSLVAANEDAKAATPAPIEVLVADSVVSDSLPAAPVKVETSQPSAH
jgi:hypothetical protein